MRQRQARSPGTARALLAGSRSEQARRQQHAAAAGGAAGADLRLEAKATTLISGSPSTFTSGSKERVGRMRHGHASSPAALCAGGKGGHQLQATAARAAGGHTRASSWSRREASSPVQPRRAASHATAATPLLPQPLAKRTQQEAAAAQPKPQGPCKLREGCAGDPPPALESLPPPPGSAWLPACHVVGPEQRATAWAWLRGSYWECTGAAACLRQGRL